MFGATRSQTGGSPNEFRFTGEQRDPQAGRNLYYLRARYYDPEIGRFLGQDPLPSGNLYAYVGNNPVNLVDPSGLHCKGWHLHHCAGNAVQCVGNNLDCVAEALGVDDPETLMCIRSPSECLIVYALAKNTQRETSRIYGNTVPEGTFFDPVTGRFIPSAGDAFEHCFWSGSITLFLGADAAKKWTDVHEEALRNNPPGEKLYDLFNNERGIRRGDRLREDLGPLGSLPNPFALSQLRDDCKE